MKSIDQTSPNEHGNVSHVSNDGGFPQISLQMKPKKWISNEEVSIALEAWCEARMWKWMGESFEVMGGSAQIDSKKDI